MNFSDMFQRVNDMHTPVAKHKTEHCCQVYFENLFPSDEKKIENGESNPICDIQFIFTIHSGIKS